LLCPFSWEIAAMSFNCLSWLRRVAGSMKQAKGTVVDNEKKQKNKFEEKFAAL
jgi:hypothetical protein